MTLRRFAGLGALLSLINLGIALAQGSMPDPGDTTWLFAATALVLVLLLPLLNGDTTRSGYLLSRPIFSDFLASAQWRGSRLLPGTGLAFRVAGCVMGFLPRSRHTRAGLSSGPPNARSDSL